jgi:hypothetical protein
VEVPAVNSVVTWPDTASSKPEPVAAFVLAFQKPWNLVAPKYAMLPDATGRMSGSNNFVFDHVNSRVGVGTTSPGAPAHIYKAATVSAAPLELMRLEIADEGVDMNIGHGPSLDFYVGETGGSNYGGSVAVVREVAGDADSAASMVFHTALDDQGPDAPLEKMRITSTGKVGIGTTVPNKTLSVTGTMGVDNLKLDGNIISSTDTNGDVTIQPDGTGDVHLKSDSVRLGDGSSDFTLTTHYSNSGLILNTYQGSNTGVIKINAGANGNIDITPNGSGEVNISKVDIDAGAIDGATIGANSAAAGTFTQLTASQGISIPDDQKLRFGSATGGDASFEYDENGTDVPDINSTCLSALPVK